MADSKKVVVYLVTSYFSLSALSNICFCDHVSLEQDQDFNQWKKKGWLKIDRVEPKKILKLTFALKQRNVDKLEELLLQVSDPDSPYYGKHIDVDQITKIIAPSNTTLNAVYIWLHRYEVNRCNLTRNKDFLVCHVQSSIAEKMLKGAVFYYFKHPKYSKKVIRSATRYYVTRQIAKYLDFIGGLHRFPPVSKKSGVKISASRNFASVKHVDFHVGVYPKVLRNRYNISNSDVGKHQNNSQAVAQFLEQHYHTTDLVEFMTLFVGSEFPHLTKVSKVVGPNSGLIAGVEASLDIQYIMSLGANIPTWFWSTAGRHESQEPFLEWMVAIGNMSQVPFVHSISYGDVESSLSVSYMKRINVEFMKAGLRGITILFASGDSGAGCLDGKFSPSFPASSPYITSVGGTKLDGFFEENSESATGFSGGGFSNVFKQPSYQSDNVGKYMKTSKKLPPSKYYNNTGRAYPDISAIGQFFWVVTDLIPTPGVEGTSASCPTVAGIISLLNDLRLQNKKPTMGFLNPFLYKNGNLLYDITSGCHSGCYGEGFCSSLGWDPVTGIGTPNYPAIAKAVMARN